MASKGLKQYPAKVKGVNNPAWTAQYVVHLFPCLTDKNHCVTFHCHLTIKTDISNLVCSASFEPRCISSIYHLLSTDATKILVSTFVLSCLDYCNYLLSDCPQYLLKLNKQFKTTLLTLSWEFPKLTISLFILPLSISSPLIHKYNTDSLLWASTLPLLSAWLNSW